MKDSTAWLARCVTLALVAAAVVGCDNNSDVVSTGDGVSTGFVIVPSAVQLGFGDTTASFSVQGGDAPMAWSVSDNALGQVTDTEARFVNYTRTGVTEGVNEITVEDAIGRTARATVVQDNEGDAGPLGISPPGAILQTVSNTVTFTAKGGIPPYAWSLIDNTLGTLSNTSQSSVNYRRTAEGPAENVLELKDSQGTLATATIIHR